MQRSLLRLVDLIASGSEVEELAFMRRLRVHYEVLEGYLPISTSTAIRSGQAGCSRNQRSERLDA